MEDIEEINKLIAVWKSEKTNIVIGIDGCSQAGKSYLTKELLLRNKKNIGISLDKFLLPKEIRIKKMIEAVDYLKFYENSWYDLSRIIKEINNVKKNHEIIFIDGVFLFDSKIFKQISFDKMIFLSPSKNLLKKRRDAYLAGMSSEKIVTSYKIIFGIFDQAWVEYEKIYKPEQCSNIVAKINLL